MRSDRIHQKALNSHECFFEVLKLHLHSFIQEFQDEVVENFLTLEEVTKYLKMKPETICLWAQKSNIPAIKLGKEWRFRKDVIDEWLNQRFNEKLKPIIIKLDVRNNRIKLL